MTGGARVPLLEGVDYDPLLATWPGTDFDERLLNKAPLEARYVLTQAYADYRSGYTEGVHVWDDWLWLFEKFGPDNEGVRVGLLGLLFLRHEARHHLDFYSTPLGWLFPSLLAGEYLRLRQLTQARPGSPEAEEPLRRLVRNLRVQSLLAGNVPRLDKKLWNQDPLFERRTKLGTFRYRRDRNDPELTIASIEPLGGTERALSVNSILEARAIIETSGHMAGRLRAAGASQEKIVPAVELLLRITVNIARDDYWTLLNVGLPAVDLTDAATKLVEGGPRPALLMIATWFALHIQPFSKDLDVSSIAPFRAVFALAEFFKYSDEELARPNVDWADILEQLSNKIGELPLQLVAPSHEERLEALEDSLNQGRQFSGLAYEHLSYLLKVAREGIALRGKPLTWVDKVGWPEEEDPYTIVNFGATPPDIETAWSRLDRVHRMVRGGRVSASVVIEMAKSLF